jgi:hypothetical protein
MRPFFVLDSDPPCGLESDSGPSFVRIKLCAKHLTTNGGMTVLAGAQFRVTVSPFGEVAASAFSRRMKRFT